MPVIFQAIYGLLLSLFFQNSLRNSSVCRTIPGDIDFPTQDAWNDLNRTVNGRLARVVPSAAYCHNLSSGNCTDVEWFSAVFRADIPGAMNQVNFEQDYDAEPPSLCLRSNSTICEQGRVPLLAVIAETAEDIQAGVDFARIHNLRLAVKASGHDYLGRSTAKSSLLISTRALQDISFTDHFLIGHQDFGSAVTVGSGVTLKSLYVAAKEQGRIFVGGTAATVVLAGGYVQGGGHSALSPMYGLASDNALEFSIVVANGQLLTANEIENSDLFWALRGGGAGSWGVIVSATFRTYPTFNTTVCSVNVTTSKPSTMGEIAAIHAHHIFDLDPYKSGQYFWAAVVPGSTPPLYLMSIATYFPRIPLQDAIPVLDPFLADVQQLDEVSIQSQCGEFLINDILFTPDDVVGKNYVMGSRLMPESAYRHSPKEIGSMYTRLLENGAQQILGHLVAGGKVAENARLDSAVHPKWRTAKTHIVLVNRWTDQASLEEINAQTHRFTKTQLPLFDDLIGIESGSYSNEGDRLEPDFQKTFYGGNYGRLSEIKKKYDENDLFVVAAGVGSERWDKEGLCTTLIRPRFPILKSFF